MAKTVKFVLIDWTPTGLKPLRKALISTHKGQVQQLMKPFHVNYSASDRNELNEHVILVKIGMASGTGSQVTDKKATTKPVASQPKPQNFNASVSITTNLPTSSNPESLGSPKQQYKSFTPMNSNLRGRASVSDEKKDPIKSLTSSTILFSDGDAFKNAMKSVRNDK